MIDFTVFPDDVFLASYPRSGNTWTRFLLGNLRNVTTTTFANLDRRIPNVYRVPEAELLRHRRPRVLKTHEPVDSGYRRAIYLVRYPGDIAPSFLRYLHMMRECPPEMGLEDFLPRFVAGDVPFGSWSDHVTGWLTRSREEVLLVRYEDMMRDTACEVRRMTDFLGLGVSAFAIRRAVARSERHRMRLLEDRIRARSIDNRAATDPSIPLVATAPEDPPAFVHREVRRAWEPELALLRYI